MKKTIVWLALSSFVLMSASFDADAKRLGGSRSMGRQSPSVTQKQQAAPAAPAAPAAAPAAAKPATPAPAPMPAPQAPRKFGWGGVLGGLAAGLGLGWLLSHFGLGEAAGSFFMGLLIIMAIAMVGMWLFRRFAGAGYKTSSAGQPGSQPFDTGYQYDKQEPMVLAASPAPVQELPTQSSGIAGFDQEAFLANAKKHFVRLQEAWDLGDLVQLKEFATVEMFEELRQDLQARVSQTNKTEVLTLEAELLGVETASDVYLASVRFSGMIRENVGAQAESFVEVWNLVKPLQGQGGWVLAGIQQLV